MKHLSRRDMLKLAGLTAAGVALTPTLRFAPSIVRAATTLTIGINAEITSFDPHHAAASIVGNRWHGMIFDALTTVDESGALQPQLATKWASEGNTWTFELRPNVRFHDGSTMTAKDAAYSINRVLGLTADPQPSQGRAGFTAYIEKAEATGDLQLTVTTKLPDALLPFRLAAVNACIMPEAYVTATGFEKVQTAPIGAGPYKLVETKQGERTVLEAHADYWGGKPAADQVILRPIPELATRVAAFQAGEVDFITTIAPDSIAQLETDTTRVLSSQVFNWMLIYFNTTKAPTDKVELRRALSLSIDRQSIAANLWGGRVRVMNDYLLPGEFAYDESRPPFAFDEDAAKKALEAAGYAGEEVAFTPPATYYTNGRLVTDAINEMWTNIGVNVKYEPLELAKWAEQSLAGNNIATLQSFGTQGDPGTGIGSVWAPGAWIARYYAPDEAAQKLLNEAAASTDADLRRKNYRAYIDILDRDVPIAPLYQSAEFYGLRKGLAWTPNPNFFINLRPGVFAFEG
jgi:peptide/nickel transport system substrate-binding protein